MSRINVMALICLVASAAVLAAEPPAPADGGQRTADGAGKHATRVAPKPPAAQSSTVNPQPSTAASKPAPSPSAVRRPPSAKTNDRLDLDTTVVTGNRELPKVLYIVPWKKADIGELPAQPFNTLLDEVLTPVDRDVFRREVTYYSAINGSATSPVTGSANGSTAPGTQPPGSEK